MLGVQTFSVELSDAVHWRKFITRGAVKSLKTIREHFTILSFFRESQKKGNSLGGELVGPLCVPRGGIQALSLPVGCGGGFC